MRSLARPSIAGFASAALLLGAAVAEAQTVGAAPPAAAPRAESQSAGERGLAAGDCRMASEGFAEDARGSRDPAVAYRAVEIAKACAHLPAAWRSAQRLLELDPENVEALRLAGTVAHFIIDFWFLVVLRA